MWLSFLSLLFVPNLGSLTRTRSPILDKIPTRVFSISRFLNKAFKNKNCHNSKTSNEIEMKLGPLSKLETRNMKYNNAKKFKDEVLSANYDVIVIFPIYGQFGAIQKPDSGCKIHISQLFINNDLLSNKSWE